MSSLHESAQFHVFGIALPLECADLNVIRMRIHKIAC
jgi:hypothetical protein